MAGDWIKMRSNLRSHPKVVRMASALKADRLRVVGGLHAVWCLFDEHSEDGHLYGYTPSALDDEIGFPGFSDLLVGIGWLESDGNDGLSLPDFDIHNGASAKRRAQEADRKRAERAAAKDDEQSVLIPSAFDADAMRTREEKRREEKNRKDKGGSRASRDTPAQIKTGLPESFGVSESVAAWAKEKKFGQLAEQLEVFKLRATANGYSYADWDAAFMQAISEDWAKLRETRAPNGKAPDSNTVPMRPDALYRPAPPLTPEQLAANKANAAAQLAKLKSGAQQGATA